MVLPSQGITTITNFHNLDLKFGYIFNEEESLGRKSILNIRFRVKMMVLVEKLFLLNDIFVT